MAWPRRIRLGIRQDEIEPAAVSYRYRVQQTVVWRWTCEEIGQFPSIEKADCERSETDSLLF